MTWSRCAPFYVLPVIVWFNVLSGCGSNRSSDPESLADAQASYDSAVETISSGGDSAEAIRLLDIALDPSGGLSPDIAVEAQVLRAIELARVGRFEESHSDLDAASQGAGDMSRIHAARAYIFDKEGKGQDAKSELAKARKINSRFRQIRD